MQNESHRLNKFPGASNIMPWKVASWAMQSTDKGIKAQFDKIKDKAVNTAKTTAAYRVIKDNMDKATKSAKYR